ncbi:MAG TPA: hypothetical protein VKU00_30125 [Chthonomonadaceae bacterium]|nr:hypothetical protein [Chthonomonadaceae bacterium]
MPNRLNSLIGLMLLAMVGGPVSAQTIYGPGGLFVHPTAFPQARNSTTFNVSFLTQRDPDDTSETGYLPISLVTNLNGRTDVGALYLHRNLGDQRRESGGLFARYALSPDRPDRPALAIVVSFLAGDVRQSSVTLVASHQITRIATITRPLFTLHAGLMYGRRDDVAPASDGLSVYGGASVPLGHDFALIGEIGTQFAFDDRAASAFGLQYTGRGYSLGIGFVNTGRSDGERFFVGVGFGIGGGGR